MSGINYKKSCPGLACDVVKKCELHSRVRIPENLQVTHPECTRGQVKPPTVPGLTGSTTDMAAAAAVALAAAAAPAGNVPDPATSLEHVRAVTSYNTPVHAV